MNRYKFRGKCEISGELVYGELLTIDNKAYIVSSCETSNDYGDGTDLYATEWYEVDPATVGQHTGLKDKDGKEIYEGDVVKLIFDDEDSCMGNTYDEIYIAEWNNRHLQIEFSDNKYHPLGTHQGKYNLNSMSHMSYVIEVIGNIHDSELLEG